MRATLSPAFTGSKMRQIFDLVRDVSQQTAEAIKSEIPAGSERVLEIDEITFKITVDLIASCAFGIEVNSFKNPDNLFQKVAKKIMNFTTFKTTMKLIGFMTVPKLMKMFGINFLDKECTEFFKEAIIETMKTREEKNIIRHDLINLLLQAKKGQLSHKRDNNDEKVIDGFATVEESELGKAEVKRAWNDIDLAAQCLIFFFGGFQPVRKLNFLDQVLKRYLIEIHFRCHRPWASWLMS